MVCVVMTEEENENEKKRRTCMFRQIEQIKSWDNECTNKLDE